MPPPFPTPRSAYLITVYADRSFSFATKTPPATFLIKKAANLKKGSKEPGKAVAGKIKRSALQQIAETKMKDLNATDIDAATRIIEGTARAMGVDVVEGWDHGKADQEAEDLGDRRRQAPRRRRGDQARQGQRHREVRRDDRDRAQPGRRSAPRRSDGARRRHAAQGHRQAGARRDRTSVGQGKSVSVRVDRGGRRIMKKKKK